MAAPRFLLGDERALHDTALQFGPWRLTADLTDHSRANVRVPSSLQHLADHLCSKIVDRSCMVALVLKVVDVVTASHDDMRPRCPGNVGQTFRSRLEAATGQLDDSAAAGRNHLLNLPCRNISLVQFLLRRGGLLSVIDLPAVADIDLVAIDAPRRQLGRRDIANDMFMHQRRSQLCRIDQAENRL